MPVQNGDHCCHCSPQVLRIPRVILLKPRPYILLKLLNALIWPIVERRWCDWPSRDVYTGRRAAAPVPSERTSARVLDTSPVYPPLNHPRPSQVGRLDAIFAQLSAAILWAHFRRGLPFVGLSRGRRPFFGRVCHKGRPDEVDPLPRAADGRSPSRGRSACGGRLQLHPQAATHPAACEDIHTPRVSTVPK